MQDAVGPGGAGTAVAVDDAPLLELQDLSKTFGGQRALDGASITLRRGEVHALLGQNGSGKSTLIKVLTGYHDADPGAVVRLGGRDGELGHQGPVVRDGGDHLRVRTVHQDLGLVGGLSVVDNIALILGYRTRRGGRVDWAEQVALTRELLAQVGAGDLDVHQPVAACTPLQRTQVAIARALHGWEGHEGLLILDEPTATLPAEHAETLFAMIGDLRDRGVAILYVSHRLAEVVEIADQVTVLRDGRVVAARSMEGLDHDGLVELMLGEQAAAEVASGARRAHEGHAAEAKVSLSVENLSSQHLQGISFEVHEGEILGFTGLVGSGQEELPYLLVGATPATGGTLRVGYQVFDARQLDPGRAIRLGVGLVPADRATEALLLQQNIAENIALPQLGTFQIGGWLRGNRERAYADRWIDELDIVARDSQTEVASLSGGNQQKVVIARLLGIARAALVLAEPTAGVDIGAKTLIYEQLRAQAETGLPVVVCSTDVTDLVSVCSRILVLSEGRIVDELTGDRIEEDTILRSVLRKRSEAA